MLFLMNTLLLVWGGTDETVLMSFKSTQKNSELPVVHPTVKKMSEKLQYKGGGNV